MATSGTTTFNPDFIEAIEEAFERAGLESRSGYDMRSARRSINLLFTDWANRGLNMWTVEERSQALTVGDGSYTLGADVVDVIEQMIETDASTTTRYSLTRVSLPTHAGRVNPGQTAATPTQVYYDRARAAPVAHLWPIPSASGYTLYYWVLRRMEDAGAYTNTADLPFRFLPAFISGLAYYLAEKRQQANPDLIARLEQRYKNDWIIAADEDREKSTLSIVPRAGAYRVT